MFSKVITEKTQKVSKALRKANKKVVTAESCTGGLIGAAFTQLPGSSEVFERGYITYSNDAKIELLTVPTIFIEDFGAVSKQVAIAMAEGALLMSKADISISVTGIAGPDGDTHDKPIGTIHIACAQHGKETSHRHLAFNGNRDSVRNQALEAALDLLQNKISQS